MSKLSQTLYLAKWFVKSKFGGQRRPLQSVIFITNKCNMNCAHCDPAVHAGTVSKTYKQIKGELQYCFDLGSRFVDFEGGETTLWSDKEKGINDLVNLAKQIGFFSCTVTTNGWLPFDHVKSDSIWVSIDGTETTHDQIRQPGSFARAMQNIKSYAQLSTHSASISINSVITMQNVDEIEQVAQIAQDNPAIESVSFNFITPYPAVAHLMLDRDNRIEAVNRIIALKRRGYPIMNSIAGLKRLKNKPTSALDAQKYCYMSNFIDADGTKHAACPGNEAGICMDCGFGMAAESWGVMHLRPSTLLAGLSLRG